LQLCAGFHGYAFGPHLDIASAFNVKYIVFDASFHFLHLSLEQ